MRRRSLSCVARCIVLAGALAGAGSAQNASPLQISSAVQATYGWAPNSNGRAAEGLVFLEQMDRPEFTEATVTLTGDWRLAGFRFDGGVGQPYTQVAAGEGVHSVNRYASQAYFILKSIGRLPIRVEAGKFFSSVGAEVPQSYADQDFQTTRSLLFWYGGPVYHYGVRAIATVTPKLSVGAQVLDGWNTLSGTHGRQTVAGTVSWTEKRWSLQQIYMAGDEKTEGPGARQLSDTVLTVNPQSKVQAYVELLAAVERRIVPGYDRWYGAATGWKFSPARRWSFSPRAEWYNDANGQTTGMAQRLTELTLTGEYRPAPFAIARMEYRNDWSSRAFFPNGPDGTLSRHRGALIGSIVLMWKRAL